MFLFAAVLCNLGVLFFVTALAGFHLMLLWYNCTTYDFLKAREEAAAAKKKLNKPKKALNKF